VADHGLDRTDLARIDVYAGRGILIQSKLGYLRGTVLEHVTIYQYELAGTIRLVPVQISRFRIMEFPERLPLIIVYPRI
jgi:hypothetical protein